MNALIYENGKLHLYRDVKHVRYLFCKILKMNKLWMNLGLEKLCREFMSYLRYLYSFTYTGVQRDFVYNNWRKITYQIEY
jgi:hypothetical protein